MKSTTINFPGSKKILLKMEAIRRATTMEKLIEEAFDAYIADNPKKESDPEVDRKGIKRYDFVHAFLATQKTLEAATLLGSVLAELTAVAIGEQDVGASESEKELQEFMRNAVAEGRRIAESSARIAAELQERTAQSGHSKRAGHRKISGGKP